jgi:beta-carotene hydroxylase
MRYAIDRFTVAIMLLLLVASLWPFVLKLPLGFWVPYALLLLMLKNAALAAQHNHAHLKVFRSGGLNFFYDTLLTQLTGYTTPEWELQHARGHHQRYLTPREDLTTPLTSAGEVMNIWAYAWRGTRLGFQEGLSIALQDAQKGKRQSLKRLSLHCGLQLLITLALCYWDLPMALLFFVGSNLVNRYGLWWGTYWQHVKAPGQSVYEASNTTTHRGLNTLIFNNGYHTAHHEKPGLHWSLLPDRTREIQHLIPARCLRDDVNFHL